MLAETVAGDGLWAFLIDEGDVRFRCPQCRHLDYNGGTAQILDELRWACRRCDRKFTRYYLERIIIEDPDLLERAWELVEVGRVG